MRNLIVGSMALLATTPVQAHWQYAKWGMTSAQVIEASGGKAKATPGDKSAQGDTTREVEADYSAGDRALRASFWFDASGLQKVTLSPTGEPGCLDLRRDLLAKYGSPVERNPGLVERLMWADKLSNNRIVIILDGDSFCELQYAPLVSRAGAGL